MINRRDLTVRRALVPFHRRRHVAPVFEVEPNAPFFMETSRVEKVIATPAALELVEFLK